MDSEDDTDCGSLQAVTTGELQGVRDRFVTLVHAEKDGEKLLVDDGMAERRIKSEGHLLHAQEVEDLLCNYTIRNNLSDNLTVESFRKGYINHIISASFFFIVNSGIVLSGNVLSIGAIGRVVRLPQQR